MSPWANLSSSSASLIFFCEATTVFSIFFNSLSVALILACSTAYWLQTKPPTASASTPAAAAMSENWRRLSGERRRPQIEEIDPVRCPRRFIQQHPQQRREATMMIGQLAARVIGQLDRRKGIEAFDAERQLAQELLE